MGMPYALTNHLADTTIATAVLVRNLLDATPAQRCEADGSISAGEAASFVYFPWQYLNPSPAATEAFIYNDALSVIVRMYDSTGLHLQSRRTMVQRGSCYMLAFQQDSIMLQTLSQNGRGYIEIATPRAQGEPFTVEIEWYLGSLAARGQKVAATLNVGPNSSAYFQTANGTLLFLPVPSSNGVDSYSVADIAAATPYLPPDYATRVLVRLEAVEGVQPLAVRYAFTPPQAVRSA